MTDIYTSSVNTKIGKLYLAASKNGITHITLPQVSAVDFKASLKLDFPNVIFKKENALLKEASLQLSKYFKGTLFEFTLPLDIYGTDFQKKVLNRVSKIKYGTTKTYGQIAKESGSAKAYRAVGSTNASNRIPIIIPCHRVVALVGLGGYAGGIELKQQLLLHEKINIHN